ncbi:PREDICTED: glycine N-acyltransferase-like protein 2 [Hipposideros armiger]|uniref:Glycine N-acyltransferase-like protein n=1 Tax=Hipposideros armiger TaxID=186990 RepID=A0A8B7SE55_HIPAR|nr:PREDICTED: glycine N-acyltransferase-like protein 2 [Hipposideros armiger]
MFVLHEPQKLQILYESLEKNIPESLKVYGVIFNIKNKNPFNMEVLVDAWPDYQIVITRPQKQEMKDDLDHYTNTYHIFTKAPDKIEEALACPQVINWEQVFQIQGFQESLDEAIKKVAASKSVQVDYTRTKLFMMEIPVKRNTSSNGKMDMMELVNMPTDNKNQNKGDFLSIKLDPSHAKLVNEQWDFGKNERSLKYIERCLQSFPGFGILGLQGLPISWVVMEQSCELRMAYTVPKYRGQGNMQQICYYYVEYLTQRKIPFYLHVAESKEKNQKLLRMFGFNISLCGWHQWQCTPKKYC